jgi:hypothetical protein
MTLDSPVETQASPPQAVIKVLNALIAALLRSPFHGLLSGSSIVLSFKGRKSGTLYTFPVGYYQPEGDTLTVIPLHRWWKNLRGNVPVTVWYKGQKYSGMANAFQGDESTINDLQRLIEGSSNLMRIYKIQRSADGHPNSERARQVASVLALVRIRLTPSP